jgi:hypothetical protein
MEMIPKKFNDKGKNSKMYDIINASNPVWQTARLTREEA